MINQRIEWVDIVKYVCIIMVMLSHLETRTKIWSAFYTPFFLSAFFFVAGYVYRQKNNFKSFLYVKFRQLFMPWFLFGVFNILLSQIVSFNIHGSLIEELKWNFFQIRGRGDQIWFVAALFVAFIPFYYFVKKYEALPEDIEGKQRCAIAVLIAWLLSLVSVLYTRLVPGDIFPWKSTALPWHIEYMFQVMFYMVLGYMFRHRWERHFDAFNTVRMRIAIIVVYLLIVFVPFITKVKMTMLVEIVYGYLSSVVGIAVLVSVSKAVKTNSYINYVGQNTLVFYALHGKVYSIIQTILKRTVPVIYNMILNNVMVSSVFCLFFSLVLSIILIIPAYVLNRYFPFVLGRTKKEKICCSWRKV